MVVRIMLMVPLYAISSLISLFSLEAAFVIDAIRDIYEAFVIYCFFELLIAYLGGERSLLIMLHGRPPKPPVFPVNLFKREIDVSDPYTFLFLKRGIIQYVQVKPILAAATLILKGTGKYNEGDFRADSGYLYVSVVYNVSICLALYCLAMFWVCVNDDLKPFRPIPKFLCVKGILFFSFWQSIAISILVATHVIKQLGPYKDAEHISLGLTDTLICIEMPIFAIAHNYAFSYKDFIDPHISFVARMPFYYAFRDAFGCQDVVEDSKSTLRGEGMDYREFEPAEGLMHQGLGRERRIRAGLRYSKGGQRKYWLPKTDSGTNQGRTERAVNRAIGRVAGRDQIEEVHAPLLSHQAESVVHLAPDLEQEEERNDIWENRNDDDDDDDGGFELPFGGLDEADEELFAHSKQYVFGDYNYPCIDVSSEHARVMMWTEEERILRDERGAWFSPLRGAKGRVAMQGRNGPAWEGYGAVGNTTGRRQRGHTLELVEEEDGKIIDLNDGGGRDKGGGDSQRVKLQWTRTQHLPHSSTSASASPSRDLYPRSPSSPSSRSHSRSESNSKTRLTRTISGHDGASPHTSSGSPTNILPPDAVDLIVEDNEARERGQVKERRKGEPGMRGSSSTGGLRKVYRRGFEVETSEGDKAKGQVEVENEAVGAGDDEDIERRRRYMNVGERVLDVVGGDRSRRQSAGSGSGSPTALPLPDVWEPDVEEDVVVARVTTPPLHARISGDDMHHVNPWV
ncbi:hypothetical protein AGABI1DRAFT_76810 [Agaricus bisporus var. burnettii JB137-S8]|uniref:DUF300-domain-containing protein n=1 Tax=Agaricus bisporus var. burnettii (strain JB137-S8 / ATCC MYA-4627 / FGSC 10392) TaxID=597362 RepID=K5X3Q4_AGABU|nr:uncharacterized protein AGABI1DRAFT_76810 [Agaricus bisporus var. burnettii JB137-S8]EKM77803.1 hypothetical protein AGABI1DRAFT_76810 [Agaricus bisporus var. burnettii JB137-S8]